MKDKITEQNSELYFHNTKKLLRNYRDVVWSVEASVIKAKLQFKKEFDTNIEDFLDMAYCAGMDLGDSKLENHVRNIEKSKNMLEIIDISIQTLREKHKFGEKYYWILYYSYLSSKELSYTDDVIDAVRIHCKDVSRRSFYRSRIDAITHLSSILWGYTTHDCIDLAELFNKVNSKNISHSNI